MEQKTAIYPTALPLLFFNFTYLKRRNKRETPEILNAAVIVTGYSAKEKVVFFWSFGATVGPYSTSPKQLSQVLGWTVLIVVSH